MRIKTLFHYILGMCCPFFVLVSCVEDRYDLDKDVDLTMTVGGDEFALPVGNTEKITMSKIMDLDDSNTIVADPGTGGYYLMAMESVKPAEVEIRTVALPEPGITPTESEVKLPTSVSDPGNGMLDIQLSNGLEETTSFSLENNDVPEEILEISHAELEMIVDLNFSVEGMENIADALYFKSIKIVFPPFFISDELDADNALVLTTGTLLPGQVLKHSITVSAIDFSLLPSGQGLSGNALNIAGDITVKGEVYVKTGELGGSVSGGEAFRMKTEIIMHSSSIHAVTGKFDPEIVVNDIKPILFDEIPEFLQSDGIYLDVLNPMVIVGLNNETPLKADVSGIFSSFWQETVIGMVEVGNYYGKAPLIMDAEVETLAYLSDSGTGAPAGAKNVKVDNLSSMFKLIPNMLTAELFIESGREMETTFKLGHVYTVEPKYGVEVPLAFGRNLNIVYNDTIDGWNDDIKDYNFQKVILSTRIYNDIPLELTLDIFPLDSDGNVIAGIAVEGDKAILSPDADGTARYSDMQIILTEKTIDAIKNLDGLWLKLSARSNEAIEGKMLNKDHYIQLTDIQLKAPGGVNLDLN